MATNKNMNGFNKKIVVLVLIFTFVFSPILAIPAQAQWVVWDPGNFVPNNITAINTTISAGANVSQTVKDYGLDAVGWVIVNYIIERMAASTVKWINSGFQGSPAFITDPEAFFGNMGDKIAGQFIFSSPNLNFLCGPLQAKIKLALTNNYNQTDRRNWRCSATGVANNVDAFMNNFENGGWEGFFELSQGPQNPIGAYLQVEGEMMQQIANKKDLTNKDLLQGKGIMSYKECVQYGVATKRTEEVGGRFELQPDGTSKYIAGTTREVTDPPPCIKEKTNTPGSVISDQLNKQLGLGQDKLAAADEINEIVSALLNKLVSSVVGGIGRGLRGLSNPDPTSGNRTFEEQLSSNDAGKAVNPNPIIDYFGNTPNTEILNEPIPNLNCLDQSNDPNSPYYYETLPQICANPVDLNTGRPTCDPQTDPTCVWTP